MPLALYSALGSGLILSPFRWSWLLVLTSSNKLQFFTAPWGRAEAVMWTKWSGFTFIMSPCKQEVSKVNIFHKSWSWILVSIRRYGRGVEQYCTMPGSISSQWCFCPILLPMYALKFVHRTLFCSFFPFFFHFVWCPKYVVAGTPLMSGFDVCWAMGWCRARAVTVNYLH